MPSIAQTLMRSTLVFLTVIHWLWFSVEASDTECGSWCCINGRVCTEGEEKWVPITALVVAGLSISGCVACCCYCCNKGKAPQGVKTPQTTVIASRETQEHHKAELIASREHDNMTEEEA